MKIKNEFLKNRIPVGVKKKYLQYSYQISKIKTNINNKKGFKHDNLIKLRELELERMEEVLNIYKWYIHSRIASVKKIKILDDFIEPEFAIP